MSSLLTNSSAMNALSTLRMISSNQATNQSRITTGLAVQSAKDNAAYFTISESLKSDSGMYSAIDDGLTLTKNSIATARAGAEEIVNLATRFVERVAFAQSDATDKAAVQLELNEIAQQMAVVIDQAKFNGDDLIDSGAPATQTVVTGVQRSAGGIAVTSVSFQSVDLGTLQTQFAALSISNTPATAANQLIQMEALLSQAIDAATTLGVAENTIDAQKAFSKALVDVLDEGVGAMVDADMEEEAARNQALQVQEQVAIQSLAIANQKPQSLLQLFR